jgi:hypothetical protein
MKERILSLAVNVARYCSWVECGWQIGQIPAALSLHTSRFDRNHTRKGHLNGGDVSCSLDSLAFVQVRSIGPCRVDELCGNLVLDWCVVCLALAEVLACVLGVVPGGRRRHNHRELGVSGG